MAITKTSHALNKKLEYRRQKMQDDLRAELIKQFPSEVIETKDMTGKEYYACPTCKRAVATGTEKCQGCDRN